MDRPTYYTLVKEYWAYYISLEKQFVETKRYVEFDYINNKRSYSIEYLKLFQAVCSEIDVVGKVLASSVDQSFNPTKTTGINEWWFYITQEYTDLCERECLLLEEYTIKPWNNYYVVENPNSTGKKYILDNTDYHKGKTPSWWNDYNSVKHNRTGKFDKHSTNYAKANLKNLFHSFAALYSLEVMLIKLVFSDNDLPLDPEMTSKLFTEDLPFYPHLLYSKG